MSLKSDLGKAKGLGASGEGSHHWWMQRVTAIALVPLVVWFVIKMIGASSSGILGVLSSPIQATLLVLFIGFALYHGSLGLRVVIEDYIHGKFLKPTLILIVNFTSIVLGTLALISVLFFHFNAAGSKYGARGHHGGFYKKGVQCEKRYKKHHKDGVQCEKSKKTAPKNIDEL